MVDHYDHVYSWTIGAEYLFGWRLLIIWLSLGTCMNIIQFFLHYLLPDLRRQPVSRVILWLSLVDFTYDFYCVTQCSLNLRFELFVGEYVNCIVQSIVTEILMILSGISLATLLYIGYLAILKNRILSNHEIDRIHLVALGYCSLIAILGNVGPGSSYLNSSGLYCYSANQFLFQALLFHLSYVIPLFCTLIFFWVRIYLTVKDMTAFLVKRNIAIQARKGQVRIVKRMSWYIFIFMICLGPYEITLLYTWISQNSPPYQMWVVTGLAAHVLTISNPIMYYVLNQSARKIVYDYFYQRIYGKPRDPSASSKSPNTRSRSGMTYGPEGVPRELENLILALSNPSVLNEMLAYADQLLCSEGILFWIDVQVWKGMIPEELAWSETPTSLLTPLEEGETPVEAKGMPELEDGVSPARVSVKTTYMGTDSKHVTPEKSKKIVSKTGSPSSGSKRRIPVGPVHDIQELRKFAYDIFYTYFAGGSAPLLLNVPDYVYNDITERLELKIEMGPHGVCRRYCDFEFSPNLRNLFDSAEKEMLSLMYDNIYIPFNAKNNLKIVLDSEEKLKDLKGGNLLPFHKLEENPEMELAGLVIPRGEGGVATGLGSRDSDKLLDQSGLGLILPDTPTPGSESETLTPIADLREATSAS